MMARNADRHSPVVAALLPLRCKRHPPHRPSRRLLRREVLVEVGFRPAHPSGAIWVEQSDGGPVLHLRGEIDTATVSRYQARPGAADSSNGEHVVAVDARQVTFLNSTGLGLLIRSTDAHREAGHSPALFGPTRAVLRVLELTGTTALFHIL